MESTSTALVGYTGFVGQSLLRQRSFTHTFNRQNIEQLPGSNYAEVVCAGAPAEKWRANLEPDEDFNNISKLWQTLSRIQAVHFTLISTVDVFGSPFGVDEDSDPSVHENTSYGANRLWLEQKVRETFEHHHIIRLPGLVGTGLKKNVIYDLAHNNNLRAIDQRNVFQFYPTANLAKDIDLAKANGLKTLHLTAEPVSVAEVAYFGFSAMFENVLDREPVSYDFRTKHAQYWGVEGHYQYSATQTFKSINEYSQTVNRLNRES